MATTAHMHWVLSEVGRTVGSGRNRNGAVDVGRELSRGSALLPVVERISKRQREAMGLPDAALTLWNVAVMACLVLTDDQDQRPLVQRAEALLEDLLPDEAWAAESLEPFAAYLGGLSAGELPLWLKAVNRSDARATMERMIGAAQYRVLVDALSQDGAVIVLALRRASRALMPYAVAFEDVTDILPLAQRELLTAFDAGSSRILSLFVSLDEGLEKLIGFGLPMASTHPRADESGALDTADLEVLTERLREIASGRSLSVVADLSSALARKMQGARDAVRFSADPVSQAASSLVELIDRLFRTAFTDDEVMAFVGSAFAEEEGLTYRRDGQLWPTKRAQALCFAHAGHPLDTPSPPHAMLAHGLVHARSNLQRLKHADLGSMQESEELMQYLAAVEGSLLLAVRVAWLMAPADQLVVLRERLSA